MANEHEAQIEEYMQKPYHCVFELKEDGGYSASVIEFEECECLATGSTREEAWENLEKAMRLWLEEQLLKGEPGRNYIIEYFN